MKLRNHQNKTNTKEISVVQFTGLIFATIFEFLGFLFFFAVMGYYIQNYFFKDNFIILTLFIFLGLIVGLLYMYKKVRFLSSVKVSNTVKKTIGNIFFAREKETQKRIQNVREDLREYEKKMEELLKKYEKK